MDAIKITPMMQQWLDAKAQAQDAIVLFRMGDFYEMFGEDATRAAPILELAITTRDREKTDSSMPMAGFPHHAMSAYIAKLLQAGHKVAICDQTEDPAQAKGLVRREVTRLVTPGTVIDEDALKPNENNYLAAIVFHPNQMGLALLDLSTGEFRACVSDQESTLVEELRRSNPAETIVLDNPQATPARLSLLTEERDGAFRRVELFKDGVAQKRVFSQFTADSWFSQKENAAACDAVEMILHYVAKTQRQIGAHIGQAKPYAIDSQLLMDQTTRQHLHVCGGAGQLRAEGTLLWVMDKTCTAMGSRALSKMLIYPSTSLETIEARQNVVQAFVEEPGVRQQVRQWLRQLYDVERLLAKLASGRISPREMGNLRNSIQILQPLQESLASSQHELLRQIASQIDVFEELSVFLEKALVDAPPLLLKDGGVFRQGFDPSLDEYLQLSQGGIDALQQIEERERQATGISSLKIKLTRVYGYAIEVTQTHLSKVPSHYIRKQTIANGERFITHELRDLEDKIQHAQANRLRREAELFEELRTHVLAVLPQLGQMAKVIAQYDALSTFAEVAEARRFTRPLIRPAAQRILKLYGNRHPVAEIVAERRGRPFVANDIELGGRDRQILLMTGPNMAGKSTIMRQVAIAQVLAQAGSFVPATYAELSICDRLFTRVGATDDILSSRSTFMVEMEETAQILRHATPISLVLLDEIGRGTSTFDGLSIAWSVTEYMHDVVGARTIFATHYHELTKLDQALPRLHNVRAGVSEQDGDIRFLYTLQEGPSLQSYGIQVAKLAGLPAVVVKRATSVLKELENNRHIEKTTNRAAEPQLGLF